MMEPGEELERVRSASLAARPLTTDLLSQAAADPALALASAREVMLIVLQNSDPAWPALDRWRELLPPWFVGLCSDDAQTRDCVIDVWSLRAWIYWFRPDLRRWRWWGAEAAPGEIRLAVLPQSQTYLKGAAQWLLKASAQREA
ncbi:MAG TPA: hypothetical protein VNI34_07650 [Candidatus Nitrosotalea sp.]|nr:hypothetical protein [Candidatus Nitrosotalea sp.]